MIKIIVSTMFFPLLIIASEHTKTQEEQIHETIAHVFGSSLRQMKKNSEECSKKYQGYELQACLKGYETADKNLNKPVK